MNRPFKVVPLRPEDEKKAEIVEAIINQPLFVDRVTAMVSEYVRRVILPEILYDTQLSPDEIAVIEQEIIESNREVSE